MVLLSHQIISYLLPLLLLHFSHISLHLFSVMATCLKHYIRDCLLIPIPKPNKDPSLSDSYRPIALAPNLSKVLESCILIQYQSCLTTSDLQFGFKRGFSTTMCTSILKNVVSKYIIRTVVRIVGMGRMSHICNTKCSRL